MSDIARDEYGRDVSKLARMYAQNGLGRYLSGDPAEIQALINAGLSVTDANFIADYSGVDKTQLNNLIASGQGGYQALSTIYGATYVPNVDANVTAGTGLTPAQWAAQQDAVQNAALTASQPATSSSGGTTTTASSGGTGTGTTAGTSTTTGAGTVTTPPPVTAGLTIPSTILGIPTLYWALGAGVGAIFLLKEAG
jgi:hypothetical protein